MHRILSLVLVVTLLATVTTAAHSYHEAASAEETAAGSLATTDGQAAQQPPSPLGALHADEIACNGGEEPSEAEQEGRFQSSKSITGTKIFYTVKEGDSLRRIGARFGVNGVFLARTNGLNPKKPLQTGQKLAINTRRIIPKTIRDGIVINIPDRTLYLFKNNKLARVIPVGLGMPTALDTSVWRTPTGTFTITSKVKDPTWFVPSSIQNKMKKEGKPVKTIVPPGKENPLGKYALKTSLTGILIHGTIFPESIYSFSSHGCIRVLPKSMEAIFAGIPINTRGEIIYQPVKLTKADDKYVFLEVHDDVYGQVKDLKSLTKRLIKQHQAEHLVDWEKINTLLARKTGTPEDITLAAPKQATTGACEQQQHTSAL